MHSAPTIDINLFVHNGASTVAAAIDSVLAQTWREWRLTLIDDGSTDGTAAILQRYANAHPHILVKRNRCNTGAIGAFQRGLWLGNADYVMPKSADDLIAPEFIERIMDVMLARPACAMVHAGALSFSGAGSVDFEYPAQHRLHAVDDEPVSRAAHVMARYTSSPSFWGVYRREAVDRLAPIACRAGWDHVLLAELALYGEIRHVPDVLYWRRGTGRPVLELARAATAEAARGVELGSVFADAMWCMPRITNAFAHIENFAVARLPTPQRVSLMLAARDIFVQRWRPFMLQEVAAARDHIMRVVNCAVMCDPLARELARLQLDRLLAAIAMLLPDVDLSRERAELALLCKEREACLA